MRISDWSSDVCSSDLIVGETLFPDDAVALAERLLNARFGDDLVDHHTYCIVGDGCLMEGISHETISLAGHLRLSKLIVLFDDNAISFDGSVDLACSDDQLARLDRKSTRLNSSH